MSKVVTDENKLFVLASKIPEKTEENEHVTYIDHARLLHFFAVFIFVSIILIALSELLDWIHGFF